MINFIENYGCMIYKFNLRKYFRFTHIYIHIFCGLSDTGQIMTPQKHCYASRPQNHE